MIHIFITHVFLSYFPLKQFLNNALIFIIQKASCEQKKILKMYWNELTLVQERAKMYKLCDPIPRSFGF